MLEVLVTSAYTLQACHIALHIIGAKSLLELDDFLSMEHKEQTPVKCEPKYNTFHSNKMHLKMSSAKYWPFSSHLHVLLSPPWLARDLQGAY